MSMILDEEANRVVNELADAYSRHAKYVNQVWFASILAASVVTFPTSKNGKFALPFSLGEVDAFLYLPVSFLILFVLIIAYCQGYAKAYDARDFAQKALDELELKHPNVRDFYDFLVVDGIARVWPLVSLLRYKFNFGVRISKLYYVALKILTQGILLGLPVAALISIYWKIFRSDASNIVLWSASVALLFVAIAVLQMILAEGRGMIRIFERRLEK